MAFVGGTVIDGTGRPPIHDAVVLLRGDRIVNIHRRAESTLPAQCQTVDVSEKVILPGLIDSHVHLGQMPLNRFGVENPDELTAQFMSYFITNGVTTVRCTGSPDLESSFRLLKESKPNWPRFFGSGPNIDGEPGGAHAGLIVVSDARAARDTVNDLIDRGADFIKTYVWMRGNLLREVVDAAHGRGVKVAAHVGNVLTVEEAVKIGVDQLEHIRVGAELLSESDLDALNRLPRRAHDHLISFRVWRYVDLDGSKTEALIDLLVERGVRLTPTLCVSRMALCHLEPETRQVPGIELMPKTVIDRWNTSGVADDYTADDWAAAPVELQRQNEFLRRAHEAGVMITAGTDVPNPFILPGFGLHEELDLLSAAGLSNMEVLRAATANGAELLEVGRDLGTVEKGKLADLLIVDGDPLVDLSVLRTPWAVVKEGRLVAGAADKPARLGGARRRGAT